MSDPLVEVADGVWLASEPVRVLCMPLTSNMTVLRLATGELLLHSPTRCTEQRRQEIGTLGEVAHLYSPNTFHHLWLGEWVRAFPSARVHAPRALASKRPDLRIDRFHDDEPEPSFAGVLDERHIAGFRLEETVVFHRASGSLLVGDLVFNIGRPPHAWTRIYASVMGFYGHVALSRALWWTAFTDRGAARRSVAQVLALPFRHLLVCHGAPILDDGHRVLSEAYEWLDVDVVHAGRP